MLQMCMAQANGLSVAQSAFLIMLVIGLIVLVYLARDINVQP